MSQVFRQYDSSGKNLFESVECKEGNGKQVEFRDDLQPQDEHLHYASIGRRTWIWCTMIAQRRRRKNSEAHKSKSSSKKQLSEQM